MQTDMSYLRPLIPAINSSGLHVLEEEKLTKVKELNEKETIWLAVESIKAGANGLYFTTGYINQHAPFEFKIKDGVVQQLQLEGYTIEQQEIRSDTSNLYGQGFDSWLDGVRLYIKTTNESKSEGPSISKG